MAAGVQEYTKGSRAAPPPPSASLRTSKAKKNYERIEIETSHIDFRNVLISNVIISNHPPTKWRMLRMPRAFYLRPLVT